MYEGTARIRHIDSPHYCQRQTNRIVCDPPWFSGVQTTILEYISSNYKSCSGFIGPYKYLAKAAELNPLSMMACVLVWPVSGSVDTLSLEGY